ncbi:MAG TPA: hypothetical protein VK648_08375, partial [Gemmatimonadaceae bacterium]|nr:hypothetical protein [Gemmatimonadaceae bacterium]
MNRFRASLCIAVLSSAVHAAAATNRAATPPQPLIVITSEIVIASDTPAATGTITLQNNSKKDITPQLTIGPFFADPGGEPLPIVAKPTAKLIKKGMTELIAVELSNVTEPGRAKAEIRNDAAPIGELHVLKRVFAFNVAPLGFDGKQPFLIHQIQGQRSSVTLLNPDPMTHSFVWSLREGSRELARGRVPLLRPNATVDIDIPREPGDGVLGWLEGTLQAPQAPGTLLLRAVPRGPAGIGEYWVSKEIPVQLQRTTGEGARRDFPQMGLILIFLFLGGITSLYLTYWVPNMLKKNDVRGEIEDLTQKIHQLRLTPSTLRVLLSVRRNQLRALLDSRAVTSLDFPPLAAECLQQVKTLERLIELTQRIEFLLIDIEREWESGAMRLGPTILQRNRRLLQKSVERLEQGQLTEDELRAVETAVDQAKQSLGAAAEDPKLTQEVFTRAQNLQKRK